ncbi:Receptor-type guanylate cyclase gcy [Seminavis robusta]|uniref:Receptor-type guanylate cyclase gcy n=1 Tax=Seminavis robusta TaxID=568900 RepID=A0A9N8EXT7_9STRA|nr:Receptor-type guanylate cyclase gcy [Seminavis robusta]|eukprot:Sro2107_g314870.1 Receptor-type guanylate cyclase gcy (786) ;mRNA; f:12037-15002
MQNSTATGHDFQDEEEGRHPGDLSESHTATQPRSSRKEERDGIAKQEDRFVFVFRVLVMAVLVLSAIAVSVGVYFYVTNQEKAAFETKFDSDASKILESIGTTFEQTLGSTDAFITQLIAYAHYSDSTWPFITMPAFAIHATKLLKLSKAFYFSVYPFVEPSQHDEWIDYTNATNGWIHESLDIQANDEDWWGPKEQDFSHRHEIFATGGKARDGPFAYMNNFLPSWQVHPMVPSAGWGFPYNYDIWQIDSLAHAILYADKNKRVVVSPQVNAIYDPTSEESIAGAESQSNWASSFTHPDIDNSEPFSVITFPIYDSLESVKLDLSKNHTFVGVVTFSLYWRELIQKILPEGSNGAIVVFEDPCAPAFTYRLDGPEATFLGAGDLHDPVYDDMKHSARLPDIANVHGGKEGSYSTYTGLPIAEDFCTRTISVYPSQAMKEDHTTGDPVLFTVAAAFIFLFTSMIFIIYDFWVNRRQRIVMQQALASGSIVSSLFPKNVRQQLYKEEKDKKEKEKAAKDFLFVARSSTGTMGSTNEYSDLTSSRPIADHFQDTTILFADLRGFTAWSAKREPVEVFELLEAVYGRFDQIALRRRVFKVETIGDCYVAVTGIPTPQKRHAAIMARFASECLTALHQVTHSLAEKLGEDTKKLAMRVGLHSGSVTAGVLRGEKGCFQLFGDTVNTAARMEQNGSPDRIHVSQECANALRLDGKGKWVVPREDKIEAKGLGQLDTYWVVTSIGGLETMSHGTSFSSESPVDLRTSKQSPDLAITEDANQDLAETADVTV